MKRHSRANGNPLTLNVWIPHQVRNDNQAATGDRSYLYVIPAKAGIWIPALRPE